MQSESVKSEELFKPLETVILITIYSHAKRRVLACMLIGEEWQLFRLILISDAIDGGKRKKGGGG